MLKEISWLIPMLVSSWASMDPRGYMDFDLRDDPAFASFPRSAESLQHSSLWGPQYLTGGAGEGRQLLQNGVHDRQEVKTDAVLPSYCEPPNPCPVGYSAEDGCLEEFENTKEFSKEYQARQQCMCDEEHMFDCPRRPQSDGGDYDIDQMVERANIAGLHKTSMAKKYHAKKRGMKRGSQNPYLSGDKRGTIQKKSGWDFGH